MMSKIIKSGIQQKFLKYTLPLLILALLFSCLGVWFYVRNKIVETKGEKYMLLTEQMGASLDSLFLESDEATQNCIFNEDVQKSLYRQGLTDMEKASLEKYLSYEGLKDVEDYFYVDNNNNVYVRSYRSISYKHFMESRFRKKLGEDYSKTKWFWAEDTLFGTGEMSFFIGRYIRNMEYSRKPGMLFFKMDRNFLAQAISGDKNMEKGAIAGITDSSGNSCIMYGQEPGGEEAALAEALRETAGIEGAGMIVKAGNLKGGVLSVYRQEDSGMMVYTFVPEKVLIGNLKEIIYSLAVIYILIIIIAVMVIIYISKRLSKPVMHIAKSMSEFDGNDFGRIKVDKTNTEVDQIGECYNQMLGNIERLLNEIREQQTALRKSELNMLISQINPHFIYNTLDTIYMLARINKEETTMQMIQNLSKYLRLSLSKGSSIVSLEDELENVKSYMEIQQIRNNRLFEYEIDCKTDAKDIRVLKLILQPLVENSIKYGFSEIFDGGIIKIRAWEDGKYLMLSVFNNGSPVAPDMLDRLNSLYNCPVSKMQESFPDKEHGYGVVNIVTRLRLEYGDDIGFFYESGSSGTECTVKIPIEGEKDNGADEK